MPKKIKIIPGILAKNQTAFKKQWAKIAPYFDYAQIDIMDGIFVPEKNNIDPQKIKKLTSQHGLEIHLMVKNVAKYISLWEKSNNVKKIIWHYEAEPDTTALLCLNDYLKKKKIKTGLCLNPTTPLGKIAKVAKYFDTIQIMNIKPGAQGRHFRPSSLVRIKKLRGKYPNINIEVDGGVNDKNFSKIKKAGANLIVLGSYLQTAKSIPLAVKKIK